MLVNTPILAYKFKLFYDLPFRISRYVGVFACDNEKIIDYTNLYSEVRSLTKTYFDVDLNYFTLICASKIGSRFYKRIFGRNPFYILLLLHESLLLTFSDTTPPPTPPLIIKSLISLLILD